MELFKNYVINEFKVEGATSISFKFTHALTVKVEKKNMRPLNIHTINIVIEFYDRDLNLLRKETLKFVNNVLSKKDAKRLVNISPKELENRFNVARGEIVREIKEDYILKINNMNDKVAALNLYDNVSVSITPPEFKGELIQIASSDGTFGQTKKKFDM